MSSQGALRDGPGPDWQLIETLRWEPQKGFLRLDRHLARLARSAKTLGFQLPPGEAETRLQAAVGNGAPLRVRLTLAPDGTIEASTQPFSPLPPEAVWRLAIARIRIDRDDPLLRHKTTRRAIYEQARAEFPREAIDEVILLNRDGAVCEGTITNIFLGDGEGGYLTPSLSSGLLPGVLREELLAEGRAREAAITPDLLRKTREILVGNSLRGLIQAEIA